MREWKRFLTVPEGESRIGGVLPFSGPDQSTGLQLLVCSVGGLNLVALALALSLGDT